MRSERTADRGPMPAPALLLLTAVVLAAHVLLLRLDAPRHIPGEAPLRSLLTRSIALAPLSEPAPAAATTTDAAAASQSPAAPIAAPRPKPPARKLESSSRSAAAVTIPTQRTPDAEPASASSHEPPPPAAIPPNVARAATVPPPRASGTVAVQARIPAPVRLHYATSGVLRNRAVEATSTLLWQHDGDRYEARFEADRPAPGSRAQHSTGSIRAAGLEPQRFSVRSRGEQAAHFEREKGQIGFSANTAGAVLLAGAQDRLSVMLQLAALVGADPRKFPPGATIAIQTATARVADIWLFQVEGIESLDVHGARMVAIKLARPPRHEYDARLELWLAPALDYLPARIRLTTAHGDWTEHQWRSTDRP